MPNDTSGLMRGNKAHGFKPGQSGNPGGRPKGVERRARDVFNACAKRDGKEDGAQVVMEMLYGIIVSSTATNREKIDAGVAALARMYGQPKQSVDLHVDDQADAPPIDWNSVPLARRVELLKAMREVRALEAGAADGRDGDGSTEH